MGSEVLYSYLVSMTAMIFDISNFFGDNLYNFDTSM